MQEIDSFYEGANQLIEAVSEFVIKHDLSGMVAADHIGYKCDAKELFEALRELLETESSFIYQSWISGRRIAILKLEHVFETAAGPIRVFELSDQKPDGSQTRRFDHIEIYPTQGTYEELVAKLEAQGAPLEKVVRPHHTTYDITLGEGMVLKLTRERLVEKIKRDEMV